MVFQMKSNDSNIKQVVKTKRTTKYGFYFTNEFVFSQAFRGILKTEYAFLFLQFLLTELKREEQNGRKIYVNNGTISCPHSQFKLLTVNNKQPKGCSKQTHLNVRDLLITVGIIEITKQGGSCRGDMHQYRILLEKCGKVTREQERWRVYPRENWENETPKKPNNLVGVENRFGNNSTLTEYTLNGDNPPNGVDPKYNKEYDKPLPDYTLNDGANHSNHSKIKALNDDTDK